MDPEVYKGFGKRRENVFLAGGREVVLVITSSGFSTRTPPPVIVLFIFTLMPPLNMVTAVVVLTNALVSGFKARNLQCNTCLLYIVVPMSVRVPGEDMLLEPLTRLPSNNWCKEPQV